MPPRFDLFRAQAGRMLGQNVWRMSHNPYHTPLYDILDTLGTMVWDENRDLGPWYVRGMGQMVQRDRNHPSILLWSFCNEYECGQNSPQTGLSYRQAVLAEDTSRPTTSNVNGAFIPGVDVQGFSHRKNASFASFHSSHPSVPTVLSECCSCTSHRLPVSSRSPTTGCIRQQNSPMLLPYNTGSLGVWTLFDYFGESHTWPNYACAFGQFDIAGSPKPHAYWYNVNWLQLVSSADAGRPPVPKAGTARLLDLIDQLPCDKNSCTVSAISTGATNELFVNGKSVGKQQPAQMGDAVSWTLPADTQVHNDNCTFPHDLGNVQCKGLTRTKASSAAACEAHCCRDKECGIWQYSSSNGCWTGRLDLSRCTTPRPGWVGGGRPTPPPVQVSTLKVEALDEAGNIVATHSLTKTSSGVGAKLEPSLDIPSPNTGTGSHLVLDGELQK